MYTLFLNNTETDAQLEWEQITILATFDNNAVSANEEISANDTIVLVGNALQIVKDWVAQGNIFKGIPAMIQYSEGDIIETVYDGYITLITDYIELLTQDKITVRLTPQSGLNELERRTNGLTWGLLKEKGAIGDGDYFTLPYVAQRPYTPIELLSMYTLFAIMGMELVKQIREISRDISTTTGMSASGVTGSIGATIFAIAAIIFQAAYAASILIIILNLGRNIFEIYLPPKRQHKVLSYQTGLERIADYLGLNFSTSITDLENWHYQPSNPNFDLLNDKGFIQFPKGTQEGIPNIRDFGYLISEFFELVTRKTLSRFSIIGTVLHLHPLNSDFWVKQSTYTAPDVLIEQKRYNTNELKSNVIVEFQTDQSDLYTIQNFTGTNYQIITEPISEVPQEQNMIEGLNRISLPIALGNRKDNLNAFESLLQSLGSILDRIINVFGGKSNFGASIQERVGSLLVSNNNHRLPKVLWIENGKIPKDHREKLSAKVLWDKYINYLSFVENDFSGQKAVYQDVEIPFSLSDYIKLRNNSYFYTTNGELANATSIQATLAFDKAVVSYTTQEVYTRDLNEIKIEG